MLIHHQKSQADSLYSSTVWHPQPTSPHFPPRQSNDHLCHGDETAKPDAALIANNRLSGKARPKLLKAPTREQEHEDRSDGEPGSLSDAPPLFLLRASAEPKARGLLSGSHTSDEPRNNKNRNNNWKQHNNKNKNNNNGKQQQQQQNLAQLPAAMDTGSNTSSIVSVGSTKNKTQRKPQHNNGKPIKNKTQRKPQHNNGKPIKNKTQRKPQHNNGKPIKNKTKKKVPLRPRRRRHRQRRCRQPQNVVVETSTGRQHHFFVGLLLLLFAIFATSAFASSFSSRGTTQIAVQQPQQHLQHQPPQKNREKQRPASVTTAKMKKKRGDQVPKCPIGASPLFLWEKNVTHVAAKMCPPQQQQPVPNETKKNCTTTRAPTLVPISPAVVPAPPPLLWIAVPALVLAVVAAQLLQQAEDDETEEQEEQPIITRSTIPPFANKQELPTAVVQSHADRSRRTKNKIKHTPQHSKGKSIKNNKTNTSSPSSLSCVMTLAVVLLILGARPVAAQCSTHGDQPTCDADASAQGTGGRTGGACAWDGVSACSTCAVVGVDQGTCDAHAACYWEASACVGQLKFVEYPGYASEDYTLHNPEDITIDHMTHDMYVRFSGGARIDLLLGGNMPRVTVYSGFFGFGISVVHRTCTSSGVMLYGVFFTDGSATYGNIKYIPLPLPATPDEASVSPTIATLATGLLYSCGMTQTHLSIELYVAEGNNANPGAKVSHWAVHSPPLGTDGTTAAIPALTQIRTTAFTGPLGVAVTSDDNIMFVSNLVQDNVKKATPMLPHSATPTITDLLVFGDGIDYPRKLTLHPAHNSASDFVLYIGNNLVGNIFKYDEATTTNSELVFVSATIGYRPNGVTIHPNGNLLIAAQDGVKVSCCVDTYDPFTQLAEYKNTTCLPTEPVEYPGWGLTPRASHNPYDITIDHVTHDMYVRYTNGARIDLLLGGNMPRVTIYSGFNGFGISVVHRTCTSSGVMLYGVFFIDGSATYGNIKYIPLPLPATPDEASVSPTIATLASAPLYPCWFAQTHLSIELYVAEYDGGNAGAKVSHWAVHSPPLGTDGTADAIPALTQIRTTTFTSPMGVAVTSDDNIMFVSNLLQDNVKKATPMLPHSATPTITDLLTNAVDGIDNPRKLTLHPAHNSASDFVLFVGNYLTGNIFQYDEATSAKGELVFVSATSLYKPQGVTMHPNGNLLIAAEDGVKVSCCVDVITIL